MPQVLKHVNGHILTRGFKSTNPYQPPVNKVLRSDPFWDPQVGYTQLQKATSFVRCTEVLTAGASNPNAKGLPASRGSWGELQGPVAVTWGSWGISACRWYNLLHWIRFLWRPLSSSWWTGICAALLKHLRDHLFFAKHHPVPIVHYENDHICDFLKGPFIIKGFPPAPTRFESVW